MKFFYTVILVFLFTSIKLFGQTYSFDVEVKNFTQVDETTFEWEIWLKKADGSSDFALWQMQTRMDFNENIINSGGFVNAYFTIADVGPSMNQNALFFIDDDCTMVGTSPNKQFNWAVSNPPNTGDDMTIISSTWLKVAKFRAQLRKDGNPHNFADADPEFAFQTSGTQILVTRANTTASTYDGGGITPVPKNSTTPALGVKVNTRELAGYCFTGTGNWSETARWNNVTSANNNTLPVTSNNAIISGRATVGATYTVDQLTVNEGAYLALDPAAKLTTTTLYNDNALGGGGGAVTIAGWDFEGAGNVLPYSADDGVSENISIAPLNSTATFDNFYDYGVHGITGWTRAPFATTWATGLGGTNKKEWRITFSSSGYQSLKLSSKQWSDIDNVFEQGVGPNQFKLQWSLNGTDWFDIGSAYSVGNDGTTGNLTDISLPSGIVDKSSVILRWINTTTGKNGYSAIDDIVITGEPLPTGILLESTSAGTGSLIQNTDGVLAKVERYIQGTENYHFISKPVATSITFDDMFPAPDWSNMLVWVREFDEPTASWINKSYYQAPVLGRGYATYITSAPTTPVAIFEGALANGDITKTLTNNGSGWNLLGNPYPSAIDCDLLDKTNIDDATYAWGNGNYKSWVAGSGALAGGTIPAGQGFFLHAKSGGGSVKFTNSSRVHDNTSFWKSTTSGNQVLSIMVTNNVNEKSDQVFIRFNGEATSGFDSQYDAYKLHGDEDAPEIYTTGETIMSINTFHSMNENPFVPLGFKAGIDGIFTFTAEGMESFTNNEPITLQDKVTGMVCDFRVNPVYEFASDKGTFTDRFILWFGTVGIPEKDQILLNAFANEEVIHVVIPEGLSGIVSVYNTFGQLLLAKDVTHSGLFDIPINDVSSGILVVQFTTPSLTLYCKVLTR